MDNVELQEVAANDVLEQPEDNVMETTLAEFDELVLKAKVFIELINSDGFIKVITEDYIENDAERLGGLLTTTNPTIAKKELEILDRLKAKRYLRAWLEYQTGLYADILQEGQREALIEQLESMEEGE